MTDRTTAVVDGYLIDRSGSKTCPHPLLCDINTASGETYEEYVYRHARNHNLGEFPTLADAERNLGLWCFYFDHKYIYGNVELTPYPHWEMHAFVNESEWSEEILEQRIPLPRRKKKGYLPPLNERGPTSYRRFKQCEVPRQCEKTSIGARAYSIHRSKHEYFVKDRRNFRIIVRSATGKNTTDTLKIIRRVATKSQRMADLYGIWLLKCPACGYEAQSPDFAATCPALVQKYDRRRQEVTEGECGRSLRTRRLALINDTQGSGSTGRDQLSFRWLTDTADAVAAYSVWVAGLETETTGQRPDLYTWDDPQTEKNSNTVEKRAKIRAIFDGSVRELQFGGELLVFDTRKYMNDFSANIGQEPLVSQFFSLRREVRWRTDEPDNPPWVVDGWRYYFPVKGNGEPALDAKAVADLKSQKTFSAEYMNDPIDAGSAKFKREDFIIVSRSENRADWPEGQRDVVPPEVRYGLGCDVTPAEQAELTRLRVRINAMNACDPASDGKQKKTGDDNFITALRLDRHGRPFVTKLAAGHWGSKRLIDEIEKASTYNRAQFTDYEMPASETHIEEAFDKWVREKSEELSEANGVPTAVRVPMKFEHMPKSSKDSRIDQMESYLPIYILDDAASSDLIEKYIAQWVGRGVEDHDDGPDSTSRLIKYFSVSRYKKPTTEDGESPDYQIDAKGNTLVRIGAIKAMMPKPTSGKLWGERGGAVCPVCRAVNCRAVHDDEVRSA